jgi:predicted DNA-binding ribbon-helix-helix protein
MDRLGYALANIDRRQTYIRMNVSFNGRRTSVGLEREVLDMLTELCLAEELTLNQLCARIAATDGPNGENGAKNLSRRLRVLALTYSRLFGSAQTLAQTTESRNAGAHAAGSPPAAVSRAA